MAYKSAGGRYLGRLTDEVSKLTGSVAAYLNKPLDPRLSAVEVACFAALAAAEAWLATQPALSAASARYRLLATAPAANGLVSSLAATVAVYLALLFLVELPTGARAAGALLAAAVSGACAVVVPLALPHDAAVLGALVAVPALALQVRCRKPLTVTLLLAAAAVGMLVLLRRLLSA